MLSRLQKLKTTPTVDDDFKSADGPILIADGNTYSISQLDHSVRSSSAYVLGMSDKYFARLTTHLRTESLHFYEMRVRDLQLLSEVRGLRHLAVQWNTKVQDLSFLSGLPALVTLILKNTPKLSDLTPVADLKTLKAFEYSGGMWSKNRASSLAPISRLTELEELELHNIRVDDGGLRPLAECASLKQFSVSNQFQTEDYAFLSVRLPQVECSMFAPFIRLPSVIDGNDIMVVGRRKPFLNSKEDSERVARYERSFRKLQERFTTTVS